MFEVVKLICVCVTAIIIYNSIKTECNKLLAFALFAIWLRFSLSAFHYFTHEPLILAFSVNALASIFVVILGVTLLSINAFLLKRLGPLYLFILVILVSGLVNIQLIDTLNVLLKWVYLLVISLSIGLSIRMQSLNHVLIVLSKAFYLPIALVLLGMLLGEVKATESDGSASYIGGYGHESGFSMMMISFALLMALVDRRYLKSRNFWFFTAVFILYFVNYRTAILAILPIIFMFIFAGTYRRVSPGLRLPSFFIVSILSVLSLYLFSGNFAERFADISVFLTDWQTLLKAPEYFSQAERSIFSSRVYLWSKYITEFYNADVINQWLGHGPESWKGIFDLYAHNTYVSYLYEYGIVGLSTFIVFVVSIFWQLMLLDDNHLKIKLVAGLIGFLIMNLATMPLWSLEGIIILTIIYGVSLSRQTAPNSPEYMPFGNKY